MALCYHCKEKEASSGSNFCSEECRIAYWKRAFKDADEFEAQTKLARKRRRRFRVLHERITKTQKKLVALKQEYWGIADYFSDANRQVWHSLTDQREVISKLEEKFGIVNRG